MNNTNTNKTIKFPKSSTIFIDDQDPKYKFYIIIKGKVLAYNYFADDYTIEYKEGEIIGLFNAVINEPFTSTVKAIEDVEVLEMNVYEIEKIDNPNIITKIYEYLLLNLERWINRYYYFLSKVTTTYNYYTDKNRIDMISMASIYEENGYTDAASKIYAKYLELNPNAEDIGVVRNKIDKLGKIEEPEYIDNNVYKFKKGYCLYTEFQYNDYIYIIRYGKVGVYNIFNSRQVTRRVCVNNEILNGYAPKSDIRPLFTTAVVLQDSIIQLAKKEEFMELILKDNNIRLYLIKVMSMRVYITISRIKSFNANNNVSKFVIILEALIKYELIFKNTKQIVFPYNFNDLCSMVGITADANKEAELNKIKSVSITEDGYIMIKDTEEFYKEYEIYKQRTSNKLKK